MEAELSEESDANAKVSSDENDSDAEFDSSFVDDATQKVVDCPMTIPLFEPTIAPGCTAKTYFLLVH